MPMRNLNSERVGKITSYDNGSPVFVPHKLSKNPPKIELTHDLVRLLTEAERCLGELKGITELLPNPDLFVFFYVRKEALLSSQIEGTQCSLDEVIQANESALVHRPVDEVMNYINAMNFGIDQLSQNKMSLRMLNSIHRALLHDVRGSQKQPGEFRTKQNWIGPPGCNEREANFVPAPPDLVQSLMEDLEDFYHQEDELPLLIKTAILHSHFETIHPYLDGNGRLGRLLITFFLREKHVLDRPLLYLSLFFKENRSKYYELLMDVRFEGAWEEWIKFFLRGLRNTSKEASDTAREIVSLQKNHREAVSSSMGKHKLAHSCYDLICKRPIISIPEAAAELGASYPTMKIIFEGLLNLNILTPYGDKERNKQFQYIDYLGILKRGT